MDFGGLVAFVFVPIVVFIFLGVLIYEKTKIAINRSKNRKLIKYGTEVVVLSGFYEGFSGKIQGYTYIPFYNVFEYTIKLNNNELIIVSEKNLKI